MAHAIYSAEGLLIDDRPFGESGRILFVLTPEHGILTLLAQGVREQKSKLRALLQVGSVADFEFIEGREVKRLTTTLPHKKFEKIFKNVASRNVFSRIVNFLERVVVGDQENKELYNVVLEGLEVLESGSLDTNKLDVLEMSILIQVLFLLGYWDKGEYGGYGNEIMQKIESDKQFLIKEINKAIESTHL